VFLRQHLILQKLLSKIVGNVFPKVEFAKLMRKTTRNHRSPVVRWMTKARFLCAEGPISMFIISSLQVEAPTSAQYPIWGGEWGKNLYYLFRDMCGRQSCLKRVIGNWKISSFKRKEHKQVVKSKLHSLYVVGIYLTKHFVFNAVKLDGGWKLCGCVFWQQILPILGWAHV